MARHSLDFRIADCLSVHSTKHAGFAPDAADAGWQESRRPQATIEKTPSERAAAVEKVAKALADL